jgi:hypothetical protein
MAAEPSLGEITSIRGDAATGAGTAGVGGDFAQLPADYQGIQVLQNAAIQKAAANKFAIEAFREDLKNNLENFNKLDVTGIMEKDRETIIPQYVSLMKDLYQNYDVIGDPLRHPDKFADLETKEKKLRTLIAASKQDLLMRDKAITFLNQHKEFNTAESIDKIRKFNNGALGSRDPTDVVDLTPSWDFKQQEIATLANAAAQTKTAKQEATSPFMNKTEKTEYETNAYREAVRALINGTDEYNRVIVNGIKQRFDQQPEDVKRQYVNSDGSPNVEDYAIDNLYLPLKGQTSSASTVDDNPFALAAQQHKYRMQELAAQAAEQRRNYEFQKQFDEKDFDNLGAEIAVRQISVFGAPDKQGANVENIPAPTGADNAKLYQPLNQFQTTFGIDKTTGTAKQGVPLPMDAWLVNAYSIPDKTRTSYDPETGKQTEKDNYIRPSRAWVTNEQDPNARKVIVRYDDEETGNSRDLVLPYSDHFQILNNIAGEKNAIKLGGAKAKLMKKLTGTVNPTYQELRSKRELSSPDAAGNAEQPAVPAGVSSSTAPPANPTTGGFILNADEFLKNKKKK